MNRILASVGILAATVLMLGPDLQACGDKSLSAGGIRMQRALAARYPASVVMYVPTDSRLDSAMRELKMQQTLQQVGHTYREVTSWPELQALVQTGRYNVVMADVVDVADLQQKLQSSDSRVVIVPVAYKLTKAEIKAVEKQSRFLIKAPSRAAQYLSTIVGAVRSGSTIPHKG